MASTSRRAGEQSSSRAVEIALVGQTDIYCRWYAEAYIPKLTPTCKQMLAFSSSSGSSERIQVLTTEVLFIDPSLARSNNGV